MLINRSKTEFVNYLPTEHWPFYPKWRRSCLQMETNGIWSKPGSSPLRSCTIEISIRYVLFLLFILSHTITVTVIELNFTVFFRSFVLPEWVATVRQADDQFHFSFIHLLTCFTTPRFGPLSNEPMIFGGFSTNTA